MRSASVLVWFLLWCACGDGALDGPPGVDGELGLPSDEAAEGYPLTAYPVDADDQEPLEESDPVETTGAFDAADATKHVLGADDRVPVADTSVQPFSTVVLIKTHFPKDGGKPGLCTGTLISNDAVLTAAHCVFDPQWGGRASATLVIPGAYVDSGGQQQELAKVGSSYGVSTHYPPAYEAALGTAAQWSLDYAVIRLAKPLGKAAGWRKIGVLPAPAGKRMKMLAYHGDLCPTKKPRCTVSSSRTMYSVSSPVTSVYERTFIDSYIDTYKGASGAGITEDAYGGDMVFALNINQTRSAPFYNSALLLTPAIVANLERWRAGFSR